LTLTGGQRQEKTQVVALLERGATARPHGGLPRCRPARIAGDKGSTYARLWTELCRRWIGQLIPRLRVAHPLGFSVDLIA
jgi:hypothetical protein